MTTDKRFPRPRVWVGTAATAFLFSVHAALALPSPVARDDLDPAAFTQWQGGVEGPVEAGGAVALPAHIVWTREQGQTQWDGLPAFGAGDAAGARHLRVGFRRPQPLGSVLVAGDCRLSYLRPEATYPGRLNDERQWLPAERPHEEAEPVAGRTRFTLWTLPPGTAVQALRFTHEAKPSDRTFAGSVSGILPLAARFANVAPQAQALASVNEQNAATLNNEISEGDAWSNWDESRPPRPLAEEQPWVALVWRAPVALTALATLSSGFSAAEVDLYTGPADRHPRNARPEDWTTVRRVSEPSSLYPLTLPLRWIDFDAAVTTRAVRVRMTAAIDEAREHPHMHLATRNGQRVWLGELMAFSPLGDRSPSAALAELAPPAAPHPPLPVRFRMPAAGRATLVIDDLAGNRIRNLVSETPFPAGENTVWWDGMDDRDRDADAARHGLYLIPGRTVAPGDYVVRGLWYPDIDLRYEFSIYTAGRPAWYTADGTGGWLSNHSPPGCALFVPGDRSPAGRDLVYLGSYVSEGTHGLAWVDLDGRKVGGANWIGGHWTGAQALALDEGPSRDPETLCYVAAAFGLEARLTALPRGGGERAILKLPMVAGTEEAGGLAARDGLLYCTLPRTNQVIVVNGARGELLARWDVPQPRGVAFDGAGRLWLVVSNRVCRYRLPMPPPAALPAPELVLGSGLEAPHSLAWNTNGLLYVSDRGGSHQVKAFAADGRLVRTFGLPGAPAAGPYEPRHMNNPAGLTIDRRGRLWVAEEDMYPKRVSVWTADGKLETAFYGPAAYGGGGALDPTDKQRFHIGGLTFALDWERGESKLVNVYWRPLAETHLPDGIFANGLPESVHRVGQRRYWSNSHSSGPSGGTHLVTIWHDEDGLAKPVAALGIAYSWSLLKRPEFAARWPEGTSPAGNQWQSPVSALWSDLNDDRRPQPEEVEFLRENLCGVIVGDELAVTVTRAGERCLRLLPAAFTRGGAPRYVFDKAEVLAQGMQPPGSSGGDQALWHPDGWTVLTAVPKPFSPLSIAGVFRGEPRWSYPSLWPGLHASHEAPVPDQPGQLIGTTRVLGGIVTPRKGEAGPLWFLNGNLGPVYAMTVDGLFVRTLFSDEREGRGWHMPRAERGMSVIDVSANGENFWPSITQTPDGEVYVMDGGRTSLLRVTGLDSIRRLEAPRLTVTTDDLTACRTWQTAVETARQADEGPKRLRVPRLDRDPALVGATAWDDGLWVTVDKRGSRAWFNSNSKPYDVRAALGIHGDRLWAAFRTGDPQLLANSGAITNAPFKTGGALDLMLAVDSTADPARVAPVPGDQRLLVTRVGDRTVALRYRAVVPGTPPDARVPFSSPWRTIHIDRVDDVSADVRLMAQPDGLYLFSVPLATLDLRSAPGLTLRGDVGLLRGDGQRTVQRIYWSNKATGITADVPTEAALTPGLWGDVGFE